MRSLRALPSPSVVYRQGMDPGRTGGHFPDRPAEGAMDLPGRIGAIRAAPVARVRAAAVDPSLVAGAARNQAAVVVRGQAIGAEGHRRNKALRRIWAQAKAGATCSIKACHWSAMWSGVTSGSQASAKRSTICSTPADW